MFLHNVYKIIKYTFKLINVTLQNMYKAIVSQRGLLFEHNNYPRVPKKTFSTCKGFSPHDVCIHPFTYIFQGSQVFLHCRQASYRICTVEKEWKSLVKKSPFELMYIYCMRILLKIWTQFDNFLHGFSNLQHHLSLRNFCSECHTSTF